MFLPGLYSVTTKIMLLFVYMFLNNGKDDKGLHHKDILCLCRPVTYINTMDKNSYGRPYKVIYVLSTPWKRITIYLRSLAQWILYSEFAATHQNHDSSIDNLLSNGKFCFLDSIMVHCWRSNHIRDCFINLQHWQDNCLQDRYW